MAPYRGDALAVDLPAPLHAELVAELEPGERVVWADRPCARSLRKMVLSGLALPLLWNVFVFFLVVGAAKQGGFAWLCAVPLLAMGLPMLVAPFDALRAARAAFYAITDRRALVFFGDEVLAYRRTELRLVACAPRRDGTGDVPFELLPSRQRRAGFVGVADVATVRGLLEADAEERPAA